MDRKEKVFAFIASKEYVPMKFGEIMTVLDVPKDDSGELSKILTQLCDEGKIYASKKGRYSCVGSHDNLVTGRLSSGVNGSFAFIVCDSEADEDVYVSGEDTCGAIHGDRVLARIADRKTPKRRHRQGRVIKVLERANTTIVGVIYKEKNKYLYLRPDNRQICVSIKITAENAMNARVGDRAAADIIKYSDGGKVYGKIISVLGSADSIKSCIEGIIISNNIKQAFNEETVKEADIISSEVSTSQLKGREDLRDMLIFTIDGDTARDFDDAVSLTLLGNGNYNLGVHIADVSEYVAFGSALDREAYERGTSVYLTDRVIPMLPEKLSNGICSLNPHEDRLALSIFMEIDGAGNVVSHKLCKSLIRSCERMTYNNVNLMLEYGDTNLSSRYNYMLPTLKLMNSLADILNKKRAKRGALQFDFPESRVIVDENGEPTDIVKEPRGASNKMIEEFMLIANETVAEYAFWAELPFIYRNHETPSAEKILAFSNFITRFGLTVKGKINSDNPVHPKALQRIIDAVKDTPEERVISSMMLQSLMKASYSSENLGHFGLAAKYYCHFTSPIRRYPDLVVHRILKEFIDGKITDDRIPYMKTFTAEASRRSSECETAAEHTERDVDDLMKAAYMQSFIGQSFEGIITNITDFGMFVELDNTLEGLVRLENMTDDYYLSGENSGMLIGKHKKKIYAVGDTVKVIAARADILSRQIEFILEKDGGKAPLKRMNKRNK